MAKLANVQTALADGTALIIGQNNPATGQTTLARSGGSATALSVTNSNGTGINVSLAAGSGFGVLANAIDGPGLYGVTTSSNDGVYGQSAEGHGVTGVITGGGVGVYGLASGSIAISGQSGSSTGVRGQSTSATGVSGVSGSSFGVLGTSSSGKAVFGSSGSNSGIYGQTSTGLAGEFVGPVSITGDLTVNGAFSATGIKSALVAQDDGSLSRLYCLEAPDSLFEDFGKASLDHGRAIVGVAKDFLTVVKTDAEYLVYLTLEDDCNGLYVVNKSQDGFEVRELHGGTSNARFAYRIVARRADVDAPRLQKVGSVHRSQFIEVDPGPAPRPPANVQLPPGVPARPNFNVGH